MDGWLEFYRQVGGVKRVKRQGWLDEGMSTLACESVGDHMYRMAMMAMTIPFTDKDRCIRMSLVHDLAEAIVGDITPIDGISKEDKHRMEWEAMFEITKTLSNDLREEILQLWKEYEEGASESAKWVKDLDKLELAIQACEYEEQHNIDFSSFLEKLELNHQWSRDLLSLTLLKRKSE